MTTESPTTTDPASPSNLPAGNPESARQSDAGESSKPRRRVLAVATVLCGVALLAAVLGVRAAVTTADPWAADLHVGAAIEQIEAELGEPDSSEDAASGRRLTYVSGPHRLTLLFVDGRLRSWTEQGAYQTRNVATPNESSCDCK